MIQIYNYNYSTYRLELELLPGVAPGTLQNHSTSATVHPYPVNLGWQWGVHNNVVWGNAPLPP